MNKAKRIILILVALAIITISIILIFTTVFKKQETITIGVIDSNMSQEYISKHNITTIMNDNNQIYNTPTHADMVVDVIKSNDNNCEVLLANVINDNMTCDVSKIIDSLNWLNENNVDIICMSITTLNDTQELRNIIKETLAKDIVIVAACLNYSTIETYPAAYKNVISVSNCYNENATISITASKLKDKFKKSYWQECSTSILTAYVTGEISKQMSSDNFNTTTYINNYK